MPEITSYEPTIEDDAPALHARACEHCGAPVEPLDQFCRQPVVPSRRLRPKSFTNRPSPQKHFRCKNCGAEVAVDPDQRSYTCAFCDSTYVVEFTPEESDRQAPEFVIGFARHTREGPGEIPPAG